MWRRRSTSRTPPIGGAPRGAHSIGAHKAAVAQPEVAGTTERRGRRRVATVTAVIVVAAGIVALAVDLATGSSSPPTHGTQGATSSTTSQPAAVNTLPPSIQTTPSTTTTISPSTTTIPPSTTTTIATVATVPPSQILLDVLNGVGTPKVAAQAAAALKARGFLINEAGNAAAFDYAENVIQYPPGDLAAAETVARYVSGASRLESSSTVSSGEVWLTLGSTYDGIVG